MDGHGRALDNVLTERLWRTVKYEEVYIRDYDDGSAVVEHLQRYFKFYNHERPDEGYTLTDCVSMAYMRAHGLTDILTNDERFRQEGFRTLL